MMFICFGLLGYVVDVHIFRLLKYGAYYCQIGEYPFLSITCVY